VIVVFFFRLPDALPLPDGSTYTFELDDPVPELEGVQLFPVADAEPWAWEGGNNFVSLRFWRTSAIPIPLAAQFAVVDEALERGLPSEFRPEEPSNRESLAAEGLADQDTYSTVVEAVTTMKGESSEQALSDAFDNCLEKAIDIFRACRLIAGTAIHHLSYERLDPIVLYARRSLSGAWDYESLSLLLLHLRAGQLAPPPLGRSEVEGLNQHIEMLLRDHPLLPYAERRLDARVARYVDGDYGDTIVQVQIAAEILFDAVLQLMLWEEGVDAADAADSIYGVGLAKRVRTHYHPRLGGDWRTDGSGAIAEWSTAVARLRGRVVHAGYRPSREEAQNALASADRLEAFIRERMARRRNQYPRTALVALGRRGLLAERAWTRRIRDFLDRADEEPDWLVAFGEWRTELENARG
jgi:hypothetical protein